MTAKQQWLTGFMAVVMLATLLLMPAASDKARLVAQAEAPSAHSHDIHYY